MKLFIDSADLEEIEEINSYGILDGVTTNPSLIKKAAEKYKIKDFDEYITKILKLCKGKPVSLEVLGTNYEEMVNEGKNLFNKFNKVAGNVVVKIPVNPCTEDGCSNSSDGIKAIAELSKNKIPVNCTLIFTPEQALLAAKAGATFVSPSAGRIDDYIRKENNVNFDKKAYFPADGMMKGKDFLHDNGIVSGVDLVARTADIFRMHEVECEVLAASLRNEQQFRECAEVGADVATVPYSVIKDLLSHPKTSEGMKGFIKDIVPEYKKVLK